MTTENWRQEWDRHMVNAMRELSEAQDVALGGTQAEHTADALTELTDCMHAFTTDGFPGDYPDYNGT